MRNTLRSSPMFAAAAPWLAFLTAVSACSGSRVRDTSAPPPITAPTASEPAADAGVSPDSGASDADTGRVASLFDRARARVGATAAVTWAGAGGFDDVVAYAAVSRTPNSTGRDRVVSWYRESNTEQPTSAREYPVGPFAPTALATLDVNGDSRSDLLAFGDSAPTQEGAAGTVVIFDLPPERDQPMRLTAASAALDGARDLDAVRARLPLARGLAVDDIGTSSAMSLLGRLSFSSPAQLRAVMAANGVEVCALSQSRGRPASRRCHRLTTRATDAVLLREARRETELLFTESVLNLSCEASASGDVCRAQHAAGGQLQELAFTGSGPARRLARVYVTDFPDAGE